MKFCRNSSNRMAAVTHQTLLLDYDSSGRWKFFINSIHVATVSISGGLAKRTTLRLPRPTQTRHGGKKIQNWITAAESRGVNVTDQIDGKKPPSTDRIEFASHFFQALSEGVGWSGRWVDGSNTEKEFFLLDQKMDVHRLRRSLHPATGAPRHLLGFRRN